jgi:hypothetical protein
LRFRVAFIPWRPGVSLNRNRRNKDEDLGSPKHQYNGSGRGVIVKDRIVLDRNRVIV